MSTKNYFLTSGVLDLLFGFSLVFLPGMMTDQYITDPSLRSDITDFISKLYGILLLALGVGFFLASSATPSPARKAFVIASVIANLASVVVHVMAINQHLEKPFAWGTVGLLAAMGIWGLIVLSNSKQ